MREVRQLQRKRVLSGMHRARMWMVVNLRVFCRHSDIVAIVLTLLPWLQSWRRAIGTTCYGCCPTSCSRTTRCRREPLCGNGFRTFIHCVGRARVSVCVRACVCMCVCVSFRSTQGHQQFSWTSQAFFGSGASCLSSLHKSVGVASPTYLLPHIRQCFELKPTADLLLLT